MTKKQYKIKFIWGIAILAFLVTFYWIQKTEIIEQSISVKNTIAITIIVEGKVLNITPVNGMSLYDALVLAKEKSDIQFSGKDYSGLGFFVTDIGSLHSGNGKYLIYSINNKEASVGVSSYLLKDGDIIEWKLK